jgi:hypothetical protein
MNRMIDTINAVANISVSAPLVMQKTSGGILLGVHGLPQLDLVKLEQHILAGKFNKDCIELIRNEQASAGDADQTKENREFDQCMDAWRSVWLEGHRMMTLWHSDFSQRIPIPGFNFHIVELLGTLSSGGNAQAKIKTPLSGSLADAMEAAATIDITVNDIGTGASTASGTKCVVVQHQVGGKWWVVPFGSATGTTTGTIVCSLPSALTQAQSTKASCPVIETYTGGPTGTVTLRNPLTSVASTYFWKAPAGAHVLASYNDGADWRIIDIQHVTETVVVDETLNASNEYISSKKDHFIPGTENPTTDTWATGTPVCPV